MRKGLQKREGGGGGGGSLFRELGVRASYREDVSYACVRGCGEKYAPSLKFSFLLVLLKSS